MNLDQSDIYHNLDQDGVIDRITAFPGTLIRSFREANNKTLVKSGPVSRILVCGVGDSALAGEILAVYANQRSRLQVTVRSDFQLPEWADASDTLMVFLENDGNDSEVMHAYKSSLGSCSQKLVIGGPGKLTALAEENNDFSWLCPEKKSKTSLEWSLGQLLGVLSLTGCQTVIDDLDESIRLLQEQMARLLPAIPVSRNPAKRLAGQLVNRFVTIAAPEGLLPAARRWKQQFNLAGKAWAQVETLPEMNHGALAATINPGDLLSRMVVVFLRGNEPPMVRVRSDLARQGFLVEGIPVDYFDAIGENSLAQLLSTAHFGDFVAYYLAIAYGVNPQKPDLIDFFAANFHKD